MCKYFAVSYWETFKEKHLMTTDQAIQAFGEEGISQSCDQLCENNWLTWKRIPFSVVEEKVLGNNTQSQSENNFIFVPPHRWGEERATTILDLYLLKLLKTTTTLLTLTLKLLLLVIWKSRSHNRTYWHYM